MMDTTRWILVAEDDDEIREMITESIKRENSGFPLQIIEARNGLEAIRHAGQREFHCMITDLRMPKATGEEFIRSVQSQTINAHTPMLVISGHMSDEDGEKFTERYSHIRTIPKPFQPDDLARVVVREIKLGRNDERAAAHLLSPMITSLIETLEKELKLEGAILPAAVKKAGDDLAGDCHCVLQLTAGLTKARLVLSFDSSWLAHFKTWAVSARVFTSPSVNLETTIRQVNQFFFDRAIEPLTTAMGNTPRLAGSSIITSHDQSGYAEILKSTGASIGIQTAYGRISVTALARPKNRRGT